MMLADIARRCYHQVDLEILRLWWSPCLIIGPLEIPETHLGVWTAFNTDGPACVVGKDNADTEA